MLVKLYNRDGLSTPRNQIPALTSSPSLHLLPMEVQPQLLLPSQFKLHTKTRLLNNENIFAAAAQYRVEKLNHNPVHQLQELHRKPQVKGWSFVLPSSIEQLCSLTCNIWSQVAESTVHQCAVMQTQFNSQKAENYIIAGPGAPNLFLTTICTTTKL